MALAKPLCALAKPRLRPQVYPGYWREYKDCVCCKILSIDVVPEH
jgi:hypothetical protein